MTHKTIYEQAIEATHPAIDLLLKNYQGFGAQVEEDDKPETEINDFLQQLDIFYPGANKRKVKLAIRQKVTQLACFRYRVIAKQGRRQLAVWNPLEMPLQQFISNHHDAEIIYQTNKDPYPTEDIIYSWFSSQLPDNIAAE